jgi:hypothetical protein
MNSQSNAGAAARLGYGCSDLVGSRALPPRFPPTFSHGRTLPLGRIARLCAFSKPVYATGASWFAAIGVMYEPGCWLF